MHHTHVVCVFACYFIVCFVLSQSLTWDKKETKFGGVMSVQKHSLHTRDLACFCSVLHLKDWDFVIFLIFSFMFDLIGKVVQLKAYWRLEERYFTTLLQRLGASTSRLSNIAKLRSMTLYGLQYPTSRRHNVATLRCRDTYVIKL